MQTRVVGGGRISESSECKLVETGLGGAGNVTLLPTYHTATDFSQTDREKYKMWEV